MEFRLDDGNELIRTFMGDSTVGLEYERSWDLLMPVIERIEYIVEREKPHPLHKHKPNFYYIGLGMINLSLDDGSYHHIKPDFGTRKERNWKCCVEFIIWYNINCK